MMKLPTNYKTLLPHQRRAVREEYIRLQDGKCSHCGNPLNGEALAEIMNKHIETSLFPPNFFK
jgi:hypothetical protein